MRLPNIVAEISRHGMTKSSFAEKMGITRKTLYAWLSTGRVPSDQLAKMADIFGVTTDYLLGR